VSYAPLQIAMLMLTSSNDQSFVRPAGDDPAIGIFVKDERPCESEIAPRTKKFAAGSVVSKRIGSAWARCVSGETISISNAVTKS
jgi:hypothetical protein